MPFERKTEATLIDGTPVKRLYWSIISDYDLHTGLCELIDNALDLWTLSERKSTLDIAVSLDVDRQLITVIDNAGGVKEDELRLLITPGGSRNDPNTAMIGIFGVGGKRASIALGEHVEIRTRFKKEQSYQIDVTKDWLDRDDWQMPAFAIPDIAPCTTIVDISKLRKPFTHQDVAAITSHLRETYAWFLQNGCVLSINERPLTELGFDAWAYPKMYPPRRAMFKLHLEGQEVAVDITAGLVSDRDPEAENYGVYFYCNHRLIRKEMRTREVGYFVSSEAGVPHPDASLCRAIVSLDGPARLMPWNSSKSDINTNHLIFQMLRLTLIQLVSHYSSLSRRLKHEWEKTVVSHNKGDVKNIDMDDIKSGTRLNLPELPKVNKHQIERLKVNNAKIIKNAPWTVGLVEAIAAVDVIRRQRFDTGNRMSLILLDSDFEIALKEFIVHRADLFPPSVYKEDKIAQLFKNRPDVIKEVSAKIAIPSHLLDRARHYYGIRNKLIHERATVEVTDSDIDNYRSTVQQVLTLLFKLRFSS